MYNLPHQGLHLLQRPLHYDKVTPRNLVAQVYLRVPLTLLRVDCLNLVPLV